MKKETTVEKLQKRQKGKFKLPREVSNNQLNYFERSPRHWLHYVTQPPAPTTPARLLGSLTHTTILQKEKLTDDYYVIDPAQRPDPNMTFAANVNKVWKADQIAIAGTMEIVTPDQMKEAENMANALYDNARARELLQCGKEFEKKIYWKYHGIECMGIEDISAPEFIADLKTCQDASPRKYQKDIFNTGAYRQGGMYLDGEMGGSFVGDPFKEFYFIAVESSPPYGVSVHCLSEEVISFGLGRYRFLVELLKTCVDHNDFEGYEFHLMNHVMALNRNHLYNFFHSRFYILIDA